MERLVDKCPDKRGSTIVAVQCMYSKAHMCILDIRFYGANPRKMQYSINDCSGSTK